MSFQTDTERTGVLLIQELKKLYESSELCDTIIYSLDGQYFKAHKIVLIISSPTMKHFFLNLPEQFKFVNLLLVIKGATIKSILDYMYSGLLDMKEEILDELLLVSLKWGMMEAHTRCCDYLLESMTPENCFQRFKLGFKHFCPYRRRKGSMFFLHNFLAFYKTNDFDKISLETMQNLLSNDHLNVPDENILLEAINKWINYDSNERQKFAHLLLRHVRFCVVSASVFDEETPHLNNVMRVVEVDDIKNSNNTINEYYPSIHFQYRIPYEVAFAINGWSEFSSINNIESYDMRSKKWFVISQGGMTRAYHGTAVLNNIIYIVGGSFNGQTYADVECFDPESETWSTKKKMNYQRCYTCVCTCGGNIYAIGGFNGHQILKCAERYDPRTNEWKLIEPMKYARSDAGVAVLNDKIYIAGGINGYSVQSTVEEYDPKIGLWTFIPSMNTPRSGLSLVSLNYCLYALGGYDGIDRLQSCEKLNPKVNIKWERIPDMNVIKSNFGACVLEGTIYTFGGFNGVHSINVLEYFDEKNRKWEQGTSLLQRRSALTTCVCYGLANVKRYTAHSMNADDTFNLSNIGME